MTENDAQLERARVQAAQEERASDEHRYTMRISRRTVDKLGVKLYDRASAVVAELVASSCPKSLNTLIILEKMAKKVACNRRFGYPVFS